MIKRVLKSQSALLWNQVFISGNTNTAIIYQHANSQRFDTHMWAQFQSHKQQGNIQQT